MSNLQPLTIYIPTGLVRWLESEALIVSDDLRLLGEASQVTPANVARTLLELGIASAHTSLQQQPNLDQRARGQ